MTGTWIFYKKEEILFRFNPVTSFKTGILNTWIFSMDERSLPQDEAVVVLIQIRRRGSESAIFFFRRPWFLEGLPPNPRGDMLVFFEDAVEKIFILITDPASDLRDRKIRFLEQNHRMIKAACTDKLFGRNGKCLAERSGKFRLPHPDKLIQFPHFDIPVNIFVDIFQNL